jgi:predicted metal-dependent hydrolase
VNRNAFQGVVRLQGREIPYTLRPSERARYPSLRIRETGDVEVVFPRQGRVVDPEGFLRRQSSWIIRTLDRISRRTHTAPLFSVEHGSRLPLMGKDQVLIVQPVSRGRASVRSGNGEIRVKMPDTESAGLHTVVTRWYLARAKSLIPRRVHELNEPWGFRFSGISVRNQKTRWGSCSRRAALSFNWRLVLLPSYVTDYLIIHELAHLQHMNHSSRFWKVVESMDPDYRDAEHWLRRNGRNIPL